MFRDGALFAIGPFGIAGLGTRCYGIKLRQALPERALRRPDKLSRPAEHLGRLEKFLDVLFILSSDTQNFRERPPCFVLLERIEQFFLRGAIFHKSL